MSRLLERHFGRKTIILIDEYDVPLAKANEQGYYDQMILLIRNILDQALKTNDSLYFAILTGCLRVSKESIFTGLNNLKIFSITDQEFDSCFGFLDDEVREMLDYYELDGSYDRIKAWYDGYCFGDAGIYCPWDVLNYVDKLRVRLNLLPQNYWANTSGNDAVRRLLKKASFQTRDEIERLIAGETVSKEIKEELTYRELYDDSENVWSLLFASGYLTQRGEQTGGLHVLAIPNKEIHSIFMTQIREWMQDRARENQE
ncbi:MAG: AAA family ATPase [Lachnospiraceae bacterium]|nr:AAA family ATPase [Lachnospiraceae bacterium]